MPRKKKELDRIQADAMVIAMAIRNEMEAFHKAHLTDDQMRMLNPIIRNATYTALVALKYLGKNKSCTDFVQFQLELIPPYWEPPTLVKGVQAGVDQQQMKRLSRTPL